MLENGASPMAVRMDEEALCKITVTLWMLCCFSLFVIENVYPYTTGYAVYELIDCRR